MPLKSSPVTVGMVLPTALSVPSPKGARSSPLTDTVPYSCDVPPFPPFPPDPELVVLSFDVTVTTIATIAITAMKPTAIQNTGNWDFAGRCFGVMRSPRMSVDPRTTAPGR